MAKTAAKLRKLPSKPAKKTTRDTVKNNAAAPAAKRAKKVDPITDLAEARAERKGQRRHYIENRTEILERTREYYAANAQKRRDYVKEWRARTNGGKDPLYSQGDAAGHTPIHTRLPRIHENTPVRETPKARKSAKANTSTKIVKKAVPTKTKTKVATAPVRKIAKLPKAVAKLARAVAPVAKKAAAKKITRRPLA